MNFLKQKKDIVVILALIVAFVFAFGIINSLLLSKADLGPELVEQRQPENKVTVTKKPKRKVFGEITKTLRLNPNRTYYDVVFLEDGEAFSQCKSVDRKIYDCTQDIPNGPVEFINKTKNTHGKEYYRDNKLDQSYREYYLDGQMRRESEYFLGALIKNKEYFSDGIVSKQEDFEDALWIPDSKNTEIGVGKVYFRDGSLMYEWSLTSQGKGGYAKSYDRNGRMVAAKYFDENGKLID